MSRFLTKLNIYGGLFGLSTIGVTTYYLYNRYCNKKKLWVETDLEPDDLIALDILDKTNKYKYDTIVCGEGNVSEKMFRANHYFKNKYRNLVHGLGSDKDFPEPEEYKTDEVLKFYTEDNYFKLLKEYIEINKNNSKMLLLKPPRELFSLYLENRDELKSLLQTVECYMYGSFNLRSLKATKEQLEDFLKIFGKLYLYESYYASGSSNNVNKENYDNFNNILKNQDVEKLLNYWDEYMIKDCIDTCNSITKSTNQDITPLENYEIKVSDQLKEKYHRNYKAYEQISKNKGKQFVLADVGLALALTDTKNNLWQPVEITFDDKLYTKINAVSKENCETTYIVKNVGFNKLIELLDNFYSK
jgi:hypothetical protein